MVWWTCKYVLKVVHHTQSDSAIKPSARYLAAFTGTEKTFLLHLVMSAYSGDDTPYCPENNASINGTFETLMYLQTVLPCDEMACSQDLPLACHLPMPLA